MYRAIKISKPSKKEVKREIITFNDLSELPYQSDEADVVVKVSYTTLNYKDGIVLTGGAGVATQFPIVGGMDFSGKVVSSKSDKFKKGDPVVLTGGYAGQHMDGGYADIVKTKSEWLIPLPNYINEREAMIIGTAGFTAMQCIRDLERVHSIKRGETKAPVLVTGAGGGVGNFAIAILSKLGYNVVASTGRKDTLEPYLKKIGANEVIDRLGKPRPLGKEIYAGVVDTVGGDGLTAALGQTMYGKAVACCGNAGGPAFAASVFPFILRGVKLLGIESVQCPREERMAVWEMLSTCLPREFMEDIATSVQLEDLVNMGPNVSVFYCFPYTVIDLLSLTLSNKSLFNITDHGWRSTR